MPLEQPTRTKQEPAQESRRGFLRKITGGLSLGVIASEQRAEAARREYSTGNLRGRRLADLYSLYTSIKGEVPEKVRIDFNHQLKVMWDIKKRRSRDNSVVVKTGNGIQSNYRERVATRLSMERYLAWIEKVLSEIRNSINWSRLAQIKNLSSQESNLVKTICLSINSRDLVAYSLTELMPSRDGQLNKLVLDFLLKNAGREYIESIPAMYDPKTSFGPYQFTEYALYDVSSGRRKGKRGASIINQAVDEAQKIPGSVALLRGEQHYKAAFLFIVENIANLVNKRFASLGSVWRSNKDDLTMFVATAHHMPGPALGAAKRWLDNRARLPFYISCGSHLRRYALKTKANLEALAR